MKISEQWLREWVRTELSADAIAERLTSLGLEVDTVERLGAGLEGVVVGLPRPLHDGFSFEVVPDSLPGQPESVRGVIRVNWYETDARIEPGQRWRLQARLKPPRGRINFEGFDRERFWLATHTVALATVSGEDGELVESRVGRRLDRWRWRRAGHWPRYLCIASRCWFAARPRPPPRDRRLL